MTGAAASPRAARAWTWLSWALLLALGLVMLATLGDYGISGDAGVQHRWGRRLLRWYATFGNEPRVTDNLDITKYGGFCEMVTELVVAVSPLETYRSRNLANLGFALLAFYAVLRMGRRLGGPAGGLPRAARSWPSRPSSTARASTTRRTSRSPPCTRSRSARSWRVTTGRRRAGSARWARAS